MATTIVSMIPQLDREINAPGVELFATASSAQKLGYIKDGFWEARLLGMLEGYALTDGTEFATPIGDNIHATVDDGDLPEYYQQMVVIVAALKMIRLKILNLAINFKAEAGPVAYEQQASATTLRSILATLEGRVKQLQEIYSDEIGGGAFIYFDSVMQRETSGIDALLVQVL